MAEEKEAAPPAAEPKAATPGPTPKKSQRPKAKGAEPAAPAEKPKRKADAPKAPRRPELDPETRRLLLVRDAIDDRRPKFVRQATHRYARIGRRGSWRRPRGLQSKQRRHYKYRPTVVSVGFGSPARTRGLTPTGFRPVLVATDGDLERIDAKVDAALIARTVGTRRRLVLEESARKRGIHVLNPIVRDTGA